MRLHFVLTIVAASLLVASTGCSSQCDSIRNDWETWQTESSPFVETPDPNAPTHVGMALRIDTLNRLLDGAISARLDEALAISDKVSVATGNALAVRTEGNVADLGLYIDSACENCMRIEGKIDGKLGVTVPILGEQRVPLRGTFQLVGPVEFGQTDDGRATVLLDLSKVAEINKSRVNAEIAQLPPTWKDALESPLSSRLLEAAARQLGPVELFAFEPFDLGVDGLKVTPTSIVTDAKRGVVFAGFHTNLAGASDSLAPFTALQKGENASVVLHPGILASAVSALQESGEVSQRYDKEGKASADGVFRAAVQGVRLEASEEEGRSNYTADFRVWNLPDEGKCYWAEGRSLGSLAFEDDAVELKVDDVELVESSMNGLSMTIANWAFLGGIEKVIRRSVSTQSIEIPGSKLTLGSARAFVQGNAIAVAGKLVDSSESE